MDSARTSADIEFEKYQNFKKIKYTKRNLNPHLIKY